MPTVNPLFIPPVLCFLITIIITFLAVKINMNRSVLMGLTIALVASQSLGNPIFYLPQIQIPINHTFVIAQPSQIMRVTSKTANSQPSLPCTPVSPPIFQTIRAEYYLAKEDGLRPQWSNQIVSSSYLQAQDVLWVLLSNGTLLKLQQNWQLYHREESGERMESQIYATTNHIYINHEGIIHEAILKGEGWKLGSAISKGPVVRAQVHGNELYIIGHLYTMAINEYQVIREYHAYSSIFFIDFDIVDNNLYILSNRGLLILEAYSFQILRTELIDNAQYAQRIRVSQNHFLVHFSKLQQSILQEFYLEPYFILEDSRLLQDITGTFIRPGKLHLQFKQIKDIQIKGQYAIVVEPFQLSILEMNVNSAIELSLSQNREIVGWGASIISAQCLRGKDGVQIVVTDNRKIQIVAFENQIQQNSLFRGGLNCVSATAGDITLTVNYHGVCGNERRWQCSHDQTYFIQAMEENFTSWMGLGQLIILIISAGVVLLLSCIFFSIRKQQSSSSTKAHPIKIEPEKNEGEHRQSESKFTSIYA